MVFGVRVPGQELTGLPELEVTGLPVADARQLLDSALRRPARHPGARSDRRRDATAIRWRCWKSHEA